MVYYDDEIKPCNWSAEIILMIRACKQVTLRYEWEPKARHRQIFQRQNKLNKSSFKKIYFRCCLILACTKYFLNEAKQQLTITND